MKKILGLLASIALLTSCDDGDIVIESLNFGNAQITTCVAAPTGLLFKTNAQELLLIDVPANLFGNQLSTAENPKTYTLQANKQEIIYRQYSGNVNSSAICSAIPPASPTVSDQWLGQPGGVIEVITSEVFTTNTTTGVTTVSGYSHVIRFRNVQLRNEQSSFVYEMYNFGEYVVRI
ncbi:hypothetical protein K5I29_02065 [Flavobacterium agricola]|uniref:Uncharacterized protein n=1 Tax=Flavobacterium agricola TaxID=2870839 RepID=A0ABY6M3W4_9FLAO|nr:hypothetical protein [Flavobacterium agricola]UYW01733.1 hypothetical protein K5I29_02065 [Flavobacterium agricola]